MKVLILGFTKIAYMPYIHFYLEQLRRKQCEIHMLYWDRDGKPDARLPEDVIPYKFEYHMEDEVPKIQKIKAFLKYRRTAKKILKGNWFDLIIVHHSLPGVILSDVLTKNYKKKYILDYRDYTFENMGFFRRIVCSLVNNSISTFVSSDGFREYLPQAHNIYTSHNLDLDTLKHRNARRNKKRQVNPIRVRFWGFTRHPEVNIAMIDNLANDARFELHYHGREQETTRKLKHYCVEKGIHNIYFHGQYMPTERYGFAAVTDLIHNVYENDKSMVRAMANKYYDAISFYIPQICTLGSFMGIKAEDKGVGIAIDPRSFNFADELYKYYNSINWKEFECCCDNALSDVLQEYATGCKEINRCII